MSLTPFESATSSDLSRNSATVFRAAERGPVEITRRDGENLILERKSERDRQHQALAIAADLIAASLGPDERTFVERLADRFPWMTFLSPGEQEQFAREIGRVCSRVRCCPAVQPADRRHHRLAGDRRCGSGRDHR